ncbi:MAG: AAA domain-containing protein [Polyangiaceae bacterium]|nr:AAA domain-containing protein [Polyangiaceae bacterium]
MSKKNKHRHQQQYQQAKAPDSSPTTQVQPSVGAASVAVQTTEAALDIVTAAHETAIAAATEADMDVALATAPTTEASTLDLVAAAKQVNETLALCQARDTRLAKREGDLAVLEQEVLTRDGELKTRATELEESERAVKTDQDRVKEVEAKLQARELDFQGREKAIRDRELNAEAGFAVERRTSLKQLDEEAATLRDELSKARAQIAKERAAWEAERSAADERGREEQRQALAAHEATIAAAERESAERLRLEREQLTKDRADLKKRAAQVELERDVLREDREAFDERVARRAAHELEAAKATQRDLEARLASAQAGRDELYEKLRGRDEAERALGNRPLEEVKKELDALVKERNSLKAQLAKRPSQDVTERLATLERAQEDWEAERARLTQESVAARTALARASIAVTELETLRDQKAALETGRDLLHAALEELRKDVDERIRRSDGVSPFPACSQMDADNGLQTETPMTDEIPDLKAFCQDLQHRIAIDPSNPDKVLFYELRDIRCFLGGLAMSRLHLLHGISGTGKTSLPLAVARALGAGSTLVEVQAGWRDRQDLVGHFNAFERRFYESKFLKALYQAQCPRYANLVNIVVLDEMNLSHPEQYFADLLSALEQDPRLQELELMTAPVEPTPAHLRNGHTLAIPKNVWFVGTANHDETTKDFADKTYDRAHVMELPRNRAQFAPQRLPARSPVSFDALRSAFTKAQGVHEAKAKEAYAFLDKSFSDILGRRFGVGWGNRLERQMSDFVPVVVAAGGTVGEAVDHVLASKLLRKVRDRHDTRPEDLTALNARITEVWPTLEKGGSAKLSTNIVRDELRRLGAEEEA